MQVKRIRSSKYLFLPRYLSVDQVMARMRLLTWTADGPRELWDACGSPLWPQHCINEIIDKKPQPEGALDCDDFSAWAAEVIEPRYRPKLLSFVWLNNDNKVVGHVMCLCQHEGKLFHIGNWGKSRLFPNLRSLCMDVASAAAAKKPIGWCVLTKDLEVMMWGTGFPDYPKSKTGGPDA